MITFSVEAMYPYFERIGRRHHYPMDNIYMYIIPGMYVFTDAVPVGHLCSYSADLSSEVKLAE